MAYAGARFVNSVSFTNCVLVQEIQVAFLLSPQLLKAMQGEDVVECAFVESSVTEAAYFSTPLKLGVSQHIMSHDMSHNTGLPPPMHTMKCFLLPFVICIYYRKMVCRVILDCLL